MSEKVYESLFLGPLVMDDVLEARLEAAAALRQLSEDFLVRDLSLEELRSVTVLANRGSDAFVKAGFRKTERSAEDLAKIVEYHSGELPQDLNPQDLFPDSVVSGSGNPMSIGLRLAREGDVAVGHVTLGAAFQGAPDRSHGGVVAALVDEIMGGLLPIIKAMAFTGQLNLTYKAACPLRVPLEFRAWLERTEGRKLHIKGTGSGPDGIFVEADAVFITVDRGNMPHST